MVDIFISYAREDWKRVEQLARTLEAQSWTIWWDQRLRAGGVFETEITEALANARCLLVAWSAVSVKSHWVRDEAQEGRDRNILIPILLEPVLPPLGFRQFHAADLSTWQGQEDHAGLEQLISDIRGFLASAAQKSITDSSLPILKEHDTAGAIPFAQSNILPSLPARAVPATAESSGDQSVQSMNGVGDLSSRMKRAASTPQSKNEMHDQSRRRVLAISAWVVGLASISSGLVWLFGRVSLPADLLQRYMPEVSPPPSGRLLFHANARQASLDPSGNFAAFYENKSVTMFKVNDQSQPLEKPVDSDVLALATGKEGTTLVIATRTGCHEWRTSDGTQRTGMKISEEDLEVRQVTQAVAASDGTTVGLELKNGEFWLWKLNKNAATPLLSVSEISFPNTSFLAVSREGRLLAYVRGTKIEFWDTERETVMAMKLSDLPNVMPNVIITSVAVGSSQYRAARIALATSDGSVWVGEASAAGYEFRWLDRPQFQRYDTGLNAITFLSFVNPPNRPMLLVVGSASGEVAVIPRKIVLHGHEKPIRDAQLYFEQDLLLTSSEDRTARLWSLQDDKRVVLQTSAPVLQGRFSSDYSSIAVMSGDRTLRIWQVRDYLINLNTSRPALKSYPAEPLPTPSPPIPQQSRAPTRF